MSTEDTGKSLFEDPHEALREIAKNPAAYAHYLADFHRVVLDMQARLEILQRETRVHCRGTRIEGDKWGQAFLRSFPVEKSLADILKNLKNLTSGLEKSANTRYAHDEKVMKVKKQRKEKEQLKERSSNPSIQAASENSGRQDAQSESMNYGGPTSIYGLDRRESA
ncbi:hypothetical protein [Streptomyces chartreusis]|uniref:hypothetical protein n=1 Tax=Streptomyces chartreusis TaxID=1969 RepID=UPI00167606A2|nr:hypothetical protein [Streptomyces chartreusis]GGX58760.1 hypothetical protein GCM10010321_89420 [Streptomyces chartreusis]